MQIIQTDEVNLLTSLTTVFEMVVSEIINEFTKYGLVAFLKFLIRKKFWITT